MTYAKFLMIFLHYELLLITIYLFSVLVLINLLQYFRNPFYSFCLFV